MNFFYIILFFCTIFFNIFSSSKYIVYSPAYQNLNKEWVETFKRYTDPQLANKISTNPYDRSLSVAAQIYGFRAMKAAKILETNEKILPTEYRFFLKNVINNNIFQAVLSEKLALTKRLDYINACQKNMIDSAQIHENSFCTTEESSGAFSDISSQASNNSEFDSIKTSKSFSSFLESRKKLEQGQRLKEQSDSIYWLSQEALDREKKALEIITCDREKQVYKDTFVGISRLQAIFRGFKIRKDLAGIQQQLRFEQEKKQNEIIKKNKVIENQQEINAKNAKQQELILQKILKNKKKKKKKYYPQEVEQKRKEKKILKDNKAFEDQKKEQKRYLLLQLKNFGKSLPDAQSGENFKIKLVDCVTKCVETFPLDDQTKENVATRVIYNSVVYLSEQVFNNNLAKFDVFNRKTVFDTIITPTCDRDMEFFFKQTIWGQKLSDDELAYLMQIKKEAFFSSLHWLHKNSVLKEK